MLIRTCFALSAVVTIAILFSLPAVTQAPAPIPSVWLQSSSPGTAQTGNIRVNGKYTGAITQDGAAAITLTATGNAVNGMVINSNGTDATGIVANASGFGIYATGGPAGLFGTSVSTGYGVYGQVSNSSPAAVYGEHFNAGHGVSGFSSAGTGVYGDGGLYGVRGRVTNNGNGRYGVVGEQLGSGSGAGVYGFATTNNAYAIAGTNNAGIAVGGFSNNALGYGVSGNNPLGVGVYGTGTRGVYGLGSSSDGVYGTTGSGSAAGVSGQNSGSGIGVYASSVSGYGLQASGGGFAGVFGSGATNGVYGLTGNSGASGVYGVNNGTGWGVYGTVGGSGTAVAGVNPDPTGYGVYCHGRLTVTGAKLFQIDYPFDPENKYLNHFCTEGSEPLNSYTGIVTTDDKGFATVTLPEYFGEVNRDPRIQLTVEDKSDDFILVKSVTGVQDGAFTIRTSKGNAKVYWEVKAIRNDNYIRVNGFKDVEEKPTQYRGKYVDPEFFGQPIEMGQLYLAPAHQVRNK